MKIEVVNIKGEKTGKAVDLEKSIFGLEPNEHVVYLDVKNYLANNRQGTAKTKERAEISGSTRKIKKQKGTGTARAGSIKSPLFRGGGTVFGPRPRDYGFKLNKKTKQIASKSVLSARAKDKAIHLLDAFEMEAPKTKVFKEVLKNLSLEGKKSLFITHEALKNVFLSSKNLKKTKVITVEEMNTYELINADQIVILEGALDKLTERFN